MSAEYEVKRTDWVVLNYILNLNQTVFALSGQMSHQLIEFILVYEAFHVALQERCTTHHMIYSLPLHLISIYFQAET